MSTFETTLTNDEAFEKIYGEFPHDVDSILNYQEARQHFYVGWQAATAESDKRIAELKANTSQIVQAVSRAADAREAGMENEIIALQAHINVLRENLERINDEAKGIAMSYIHTQCKEALLKTPAQNLQEHNNKIKEVKCKTHPDAPHGFNRNESHSAGRYVCDCEFWENLQSEVDENGY